MNRKFFFFDIDDTLVVRTGVDKPYVPDSAREAVRLLEAQGHFTAIATGRSHAMARHYMDLFGFKNMVHDGGSGITIDGKVLYIEPLNKDHVLALIRECEEKGFAWSLSPDDDDFRVAPSDRFDELTHDTYMPTRTVPGLDPASFPFINKAYVACTEEELPSIEMLKVLPWARYNPEFVYVEPTDKKRGIYKVIEHFGGNLADVVVFGDNKNDLSMFSKEWTSIAMGNAIPALKEKADYVTSRADEDGIWNACRHFGWI